MASLTLDQTKAVYRQAVDAGVRDSEGADWWTNVHRELQAVAEAPNLASAEDVIRWWHHDWSMVGDTARDAARRIRKAVAGQLLAGGTRASRRR